MKKLLSIILSASVMVSAMPVLNAKSVTVQAEEAEIDHMYEKGNFANSYSEIGHNTESRSWRDGMIGGNGETGFVTSSSPYSDVLIYQHNFFNFPSSQPREIPPHLSEQLEEARENVFNLNDSWKIWDYDENGNKVTRKRTFLYSFHPGGQLRLKTSYTDSYTDYERWTNYETGEVGVKYTDKYGEWVRTTFTSRVDNVTITRIEKSSKGEKINMTIGFDNINQMCKSWNGLSKVNDQRYKKLVGNNANYIALVSHYPVYEGSPLYDGGFATVTKIVAEGADASKKKVTLSNTDTGMNVGENNAVEVTGADVVYLITALDRTFDMTSLDETSSSAAIMSSFKAMVSYPLVDELYRSCNEVHSKYYLDGAFSYDEALSPSAKLHGDEFNRVSFNLEGDEEFSSYDNVQLVNLQRGKTDAANHEFMRRAYNQARYAQICSSGTGAPRLYGMWTGEWNPGWRGIYTLDANVNLQVSGMNTGNMEYTQEGYITFFLRHAPDFMKNATAAYGMHDAIQLSVNCDADMALHVEYDSSYPFEYWNAGASWCLLPIYEYWQAFGNCQVPINEYMRFDNLQKVLGVEDGGLSDEEFAEIKERGWLDLEKDILLPLLTKQANFWEQIVTPRYYTDVNGKARHDESKTELNEGEKYIIIPTYSPENHPIGYTSTLTANATMDISAAKDGLDMVCALEEAVGREGYEETIAKWQALKNDIADYKTDSDGALREWAMDEYQENNNHRHLSHLYVAWPAYDTRADVDIAKAANIALNNRNKYNTGDATAGHGWMHKALVQARLKRGDGMMESLLKMMNGTAYYPSFMTDHDTNRRNDTYCTDTLFGQMGAINEALVFSNTGEVEIIPALPSDWVKGNVTGLMSRSRAEVSDLTWDIEGKSASVTLISNKDENSLILRCGEVWTNAKVNGVVTDAEEDDFGKYIPITMDNGESVSVEFELKERDNTLHVFADGVEIENEITLSEGDKITLEGISERNMYDEAEISSDSFGVVSVHGGTLRAHNAGNATVTLTMGQLSREINVTVLGEGRIVNAPIASFSGSEGYNGSCSVSNAFDNTLTTAYASKDNTSVKYIEMELVEMSEISSVQAVGRFNYGDSNYAGRINGAKVYASNSPMGGNTKNGVLVGEISSVTATEEFLPAGSDIDTAGKKYKYYMIYFDKVNNGNNISLAAAELGLYKKYVPGKFELLTSTATATSADGGSEASFATDGKSETAYTLSNQTSAGYKNDYLLLTLEGGKMVDKIVIKRQKYAGGTSDNNYWADYVLGVGCEVQGSMDGENWETIEKMNAKPDGMDNVSEVVIIPETPKEYKYIRYIRSEYKTSSSYGAWLFKSDYGNRLNVAEIEVYSYNPFDMGLVKTGEDESYAYYTIEGADVGEYTYYIANYKDDTLINAKKETITLTDIPCRIEIEKLPSYKTVLYLWQSMTPFAQKAKITG